MSFNLLPDKTLGVPNLSFGLTSGHDIELYSPSHGQKHHPTLVPQSKSFSFITNFLNPQYSSQSSSFSMKVSNTRSYNRNNITPAPSRIIFNMILTLFLILLPMTFFITSIKTTFASPISIPTTTTNYDTSNTVPLHISSQFINGHNDYDDDHDDLTTITTPSSSTNTIKPSHHSSFSQYYPTPPSLIEHPQPTTTSPQSFTTLDTTDPCNMNEYDKVSNGNIPGGCLHPNINTNTCDTTYFNTPTSSLQWTEGSPTPCTCNPGYFGQQCQWYGQQSSCYVATEDLTRFFAFDVQTTNFTHWSTPHYPMDISNNIYFTRYRYTVSGQGTTAWANIDSTTSRFTPESHIFMILGPSNGSLPNKIELTYYPYGAASSTSPVEMILTIPVDETGYISGPCAKASLYSLSEASPTLVTLHRLPLDSTPYPYSNLPYTPTPGTLSLFIGDELNYFFYQEGSHPDFTQFELRLTLHHPNIEQPTEFFHDCPASPTSQIFLCSVPTINSLRPEPDQTYFGGMFLIDRWSGNDAMPIAQFSKKHSCLIYRSGGYWFGPNCGVRLSFVYQGALTEGQTSSLGLPGNTNADFILGGFHLGQKIQLDFFPRYRTLSLKDYATAAGLRPLLRFALSNSPTTIVGTIAYDMTLDGFLLDETSNSFLSTVVTSGSTRYRLSLASRPLTSATPIIYAGPLETAIDIVTQCTFVNKMSQWLFMTTFCASNTIPSMRTSCSVPLFHRWLWNPTQYYADFATSSDNTMCKCTAPNVGVGCIQQWNVVNTLAYQQTHLPVKFIKMIPTYLYLTFTTTNNLIAPYIYPSIDNLADTISEQYLRIDSLEDELVSNGIYETIRTQGVKISITATFNLEVEATMAGIFPNIPTTHYDSISYTYPPAVPDCSLYCVGNKDDCPVSYHQYDWALLTYTTHSCPCPPQINCDTVLPLVPISATYTRDTESIQLKWNTQRRLASQPEHPDGSQQPLPILYEFLLFLNPKPSPLSTAPITIEQFLAFINDYPEQAYIPLSVSYPLPGPTIPTGEDLSNGYIGVNSDDDTITSYVAPEFLQQLSVILPRIRSYTGRAFILMRPSIPIEENDDLSDVLKTYLTEPENIGLTNALFQVEIPPWCPSSTTISTQFSPFCDCSALSANVILQTPSCVGSLKFFSVVSKCQLRCPHPMVPADNCLRCECKSTLCETTVSATMLYMAPLTTNPQGYVMSDLSDGESDDEIGSDENISTHQSQTISQADLEQTFSLFPGSLWSRNGWIGGTTLSPPTNSSKSAQSTTKTTTKTAQFDTSSINNNFTSSSFTPQAQATPPNYDQFFTLPWIWTDDFVGMQTYIITQQTQRKYGLTQLPPYIYHALNFPQSSFPKYYEAIFISPMTSAMSEVVPLAAGDTGQPSTMTIMGLDDDNDQKKDKKHPEQTKQQHEQFVSVLNNLATSINSLQQQLNTMLYQAPVAVSDIVSDIIKGQKVYSNDLEEQKASQKTQHQLKKLHQLQDYYSSQLVNNIVDKVESLLGLYQSKKQLLVTEMGLFPLTTNGEAIYYQKHLLSQIQKINKNVSKSSQNQSQFTTTQSSPPQTIRTMPFVMTLITKRAYVLPYQLPNSITLTPPKNTESIENTARLTSALSSTVLDGAFLNRFEYPMGSTRFQNYLITTNFLRTDIEFYQSYTNSYRLINGVSLNWYNYGQSNANIGAKCLHTSGGYWGRCPTYANSLSPYWSRCITTPLPHRVLTARCFDLNSIAWGQPATAPKFYQSYEQTITQANTIDQLTHYNHNCDFGSFPRYPTITETTCNTPAPTTPTTPTIPTEDPPPVTFNVGSNFIETVQGGDTLPIFWQYESDAAYYTVDLYLTNVEVKRLVTPTRSLFRRIDDVGEVSDVNGFETTSQNVHKTNPFSTTQTIISTSGYSYFLGSSPAIRNWTYISIPANVIASSNAKIKMVINEGVKNTIELPIPTLISVDYCPDNGAHCIHGSVCDPSNGTCVCPPGLIQDQSRDGNDDVQAGTVICKKSCDGLCGEYGRCITDFNSLGEPIGAKCSCVDGYSGELCANSPTCVQNDAQYCSGNGYTTVDSITSTCSTSCTCYPGWSTPMGGDSRDSPNERQCSECKFYIDKCDPTGTLKPTSSFHCSSNRCRCRTGFGGEFCQFRMVYSYVHFEFDGDNPVLKPVEKKTNPNMETTATKTLSPLSTLFSTISTTPTPTSPESTSPEVILNAFLQKWSIQQEKILSLISLDAREVLVRDVALSLKIPQNLVTLIGIIPSYEDPNTVQKSVRKEPDHLHIDIFTDDDAGNTNNNSLPSSESFSPQATPSVVHYTALLTIVSSTPSYFNNEAPRGIIEPPTDLTIPYGARQILVPKTPTDSNQLNSNGVQANPNNNDQLLSKLPQRDANYFLNMAPHGTLTTLSTQKRKFTSLQSDPIMKSDEIEDPIDNQIGVLSIYSLWSELERNVSSRPVSQSESQQELGNFKSLLAIYDPNCPAGTSQNLISYQGDLVNVECPNGVNPFALPEERSTPPLSHSALIIVIIVVIVVVLILIMAGAYTISLVYCPLYLPICLRTGWGLKAHERHNERRRAKAKARKMKNSRNGRDLANSDNETDIEMTEVSTVSVSAPRSVHDQRPNTSPERHDFSQPQHYHHPNENSSSDSWGDNNSGSTEEFVDHNNNNNPPDGNNSTPLSSGSPRSGLLKKSIRQPTSIRQLHHAQIIPFERVRLGDINREDETLYDREVALHILLDLHHDDQVSIFAPVFPFLQQPIPTDPLLLPPGNGGIVTSFTTDIRAIGEYGSRSPLITEMEKVFKVVTLQLPNDGPQRQFLHYLSDLSYIDTDSYFSILDGWYIWNPRKLYIFEGVDHIEGLLPDPIDVKKELIGFCFDPFLFDWSILPHQDIIKHDGMFYNERELVLIVAQEREEYRLNLLQLQNDVKYEREMDDYHDSGSSRGPVPQKPPQIDKCSPQETQMAIMARLQALRARKMLRANKHTNVQNNTKDDPVDSINTDTNDNDIAQLIISSPQSNTITSSDQVGLSSPNSNTLSPVSTDQLIQHHHQDKNNNNSNSSVSPQLIPAINDDSNNNSINDHKFMLSTGGVKLMNSFNGSSDQNNDGDMTSPVMVMTPPQAETPLADLSQHSNSSRHQFYTRAGDPNSPENDHNNNHNIGLEYPNNNLIFENKNDPAVKKVTPDDASSLHSEGGDYYNSHFDESQSHHHKSPHRDRSDRDRSSDKDHSVEYKDRSDRDRSDKYDRHHRSDRSEKREKRDKKDASSRGDKDRSDRTDRVDKSDRSRPDRSDYDYRSEKTDKKDKRSSKGHKEYKDRDRSHRSERSDRDRSERSDRDRSERSDRDRKDYKERDRDSREQREKRSDKDHKTERRDKSDRHRSSEHRSTTDKSDKKDYKSDKSDKKDKRDRHHSNDRPSITGNGSSPRDQTSGITIHHSDRITTNNQPTTTRQSSREPLPPLGSGTSMGSALYNQNTLTSLNQSRQTSQQYPFGQERNPAQKSPPIKTETITRGNDKNGGTSSQHQASSKGNSASRRKHRPDVLTHDVIEITDHGENLLPGWQKQIMVQTGQVFYVNRSLLLTQANPPLAPTLDELSYDDEDYDSYDDGDDDDDGHGEDSYDYDDDWQQ